MKLNKEKHAKVEAMATAFRQHAHINQSGLASNFCRSCPISSKKFIPENDKRPESYYFTNCRAVVDHIASGFVTYNFALGEEFFSKEDLLRILSQIAKHCNCLNSYNV